MGMASYTSGPSTASTITSGAVTFIISPVGTISTYSFSSAPQREHLDPEEWAKRASSRDAYEKVVKLSRRKRPSPPASRARFGFQQMARIPCYRSPRTR